MEILNKAKEQLAVYRKAVLQDVYNKCTDKVSINSICEHVTDGDHMPPPKAEKGIPFILVSDYYSELNDLDLYKKFIE